MEKPNLNKKIKQSDNPDVHAMADEMDKFAELDILSKSKGGQILIESFEKDISDEIEAMLSQYDELTLEKFISICAGIKSKFDILKTLKRAELNKNFIREELKKILDTQE